VIAAVGGTASAFAAKTITATIPIVFGIAGDPVALGLVASLNRPGGNLTGVASLGVQLGAKQLELLHDLVPAATTVALLVNPSNPSQAEDQSREVHAAARILGLQLRVLHASTEHDFDTVFATLAELRVGGLVIGTDALFSSRSVQLATLVARDKVPAIFQFRDFVTAGGLMSYGGRVADIYRQVGVYTGRILKGEKPDGLPVHQVTKVELFINLKSAMALGLTVPLSLLGRADEVIE
jgi:putative ABC transport system substrate-binding protein